MPRGKLTFVVALLCLAVASLTMAASAWGQSVLRGTCDGSVCSDQAKNTAAQVNFLATKLGAQVLRFDLEWSELEPQRGKYDETYLSQLARTIHAAAGDEVQVIVTLLGTPSWASDQSLWRYAPPGYTPDVYHSFCPPAEGHLADLQALATKLASRFAGDVTGYECRNEPNLWTSLYPQQTPSDAAFGVRRYAAMLTAFSKGVRAGDPKALVIAGATAPAGQNTRLSTSPQRFAKLLKTMVDPSVFDAYSHHPYTVGGSKHIAPEASPRDLAHVVSLGNISTLLKIYPHKPFYLTEYGYYTQYSVLFGIHVSQITQATYLTRAYEYAARYPQIRALIWFPYHDSGNRVDEALGNYSGLVAVSGAYKRSWFAFAGGNKLALAASAAHNHAVRLSGHLTSAALGGLRGKALVLYRRAAGKTWHAVRNLTTGTNGSYHASVKVSGTAYFRVEWLGVVGSETLSVK